MWAILRTIPQPGFDHWVSFRGQGVYYNPTLNINGWQVTRQGYITDLLTNYAVDYLRKDHRKPSFLGPSHKAVRADFERAERHRHVFAVVKIPLPCPSPARTAKASPSG